MNQLELILNHSISLYVVIPLLAFIATLFWQNRHEKSIAGIVLFTKAFYLLTAIAFFVTWLINGGNPLDVNVLTLYKTPHFIFAIHLYYDQVTAVFSLAGAILFFLVSTFSRYYMHRDEGYKRFFTTILFFAFGYNLIIFSGNFETLFMGWEIIGLSSFLLIAFYRNRYLPVKNGYKILSYYRLGDVALMLAMWMMHHLTQGNILFSQLAEARASSVLQDKQGMAIFIVLMLVLAGMIKSAQFPFTAWLPRAMEGPTSSSAIFYGSLSVHIGVFLLLRTYPFWQDMLWVKILIISIGALTGLAATLIGGVQPTVKTQIAYSSAAQIGIIFIEVALGLHWLALVHFAGNAFLRTYQLLVSPSVLNYLVHHQYFHYHAPVQQKISRLHASMYMFSIKEWNLDALMYKFLWSPFKWAGNQFQFLQNKAAIITSFILGSLAMIASFNNPAFFETYGQAPTIVLVALALAFVLFSFAHRGSALTAWLYLLLAHLYIVAGINIQAAQIPAIEIIFYASGILTACALGIFCLQKVFSLNKNISLGQYHGYVHEEKTTAFLFLIAAIGLIGFPITGAFIGIDVLFTYVHSDQGWLIALLALCFIFVELAAIRIFIRIFYGLHHRPDHPFAFRSS